MLGESREMGQGMATAVGRALHPGLRPDHWWQVVGGWWQVVGTWGPAPASYLQLQVQLLRFLPQLPGCSLPALTRLTGL